MTAAHKDLSISFLELCGPESLFPVLKPDTRLVLCRSDGLLRWFQDPGLVVGFLLTPKNFKTLHWAAR